MMEYKGYHAAIQYSDEDNLFIGEVFGINDALAFHGSSVQELESMFHQAIIISTFAGFHGSFSFDISDCRDPVCPGVHFTARSAFSQSSSIHSFLWISLTQASGMAS